jgi:DNA polymerase-3 subunit beta
MIKLLVDCFGGDHSPQAPVAGALAALAKNPDLHLILTGDEAVIKAKLEGREYDSSRLETVHAPEVIGCDEKPTDAIRLNLNGVFLEAKDGTVSMIATDGHRLGRASIDQEGANLTNGAIIPKKALQLILHMVKPDATVEVRTSATHILFNTGSTQVISKLFEGPYPNYRAVIPQNFERTVQMNTVEFQNKMRSVIAMANVRTHKVRLQIDGNNMELSASDPDVGGDSREALAVTHNGEGNFSIGFDGRYLSEIFSMCKSEETIMKMNNPIGACIIEPVGDNLGFSFLLMPTHLNDD